MAYVDQTFDVIQDILNRAIKGRRIDYGTTPLAYANITNAAKTYFIGRAEKHIPDVNRNFDLHYSKCFVSIFEIEGYNTLKNSFLNRTFVSKAELMSFCSTNCQTANGKYSNNIIASFYDLAIDDIPHISKVYGKNAFYSALMGSKKSQSSQSCLNYYNIRWDSFNNWFETLCNRNIGFPPGYTFNSNDFAYRAIWCSRNTKKRFYLPKLGFDNIAPKIGGIRKYWSWDDSTWNTVDSFKFFTNVGVSYSVLFMPSLNFYFTTNPNSQDLISSDKSFVALYKLQENGNANNIAFLLKPIGVDTIYLNWFDTTKFELYAHYQEVGKYPIIRKIDVSSLPQDRISNSIILRKEDWLNFISSYKDFNSVKKGADIRFFLKDKETNFSGYLSKKRIVPCYKNQNIPIRFLVK